MISQLKLLQYVWLVVDVDYPMIQLGLVAIKIVLMVPCYLFHNEILLLEDKRNLKCTLIGDSPKNYKWAPS